MLRRIHRYMLQCRAARKRLNKGLEAIEVATFAHLRPGDAVAPIGNCWLSSAIEESPLAQMMAEMYPGKESHGAVTVLAHDSLASSHIGIATGVAFSYKVQRLRNIVVVFSDRNILSAITSEAMEFAGEHKLPIIYVVETNLASGITPTRARKLDDQSNARAAQCGFPAMPVDGHDAIAVYRVTQESIARARKGGGPTLIDCRTWRGSAKSLNGRSAGNGAWKPIDPIAHIENYLKKKWLELA